MAVFPVDVLKAFSLKTEMTQVQWVKDLYPFISNSLIAIQRKCDQKLIHRISENTRDTRIEHEREDQKLELMRLRGVLPSIKKHLHKEIFSALKA